MQIKNRIKIKHNHYITVSLHDKVTYRSRGNFVVSAILQNATGSTLYYEYFWSWKRAMEAYSEVSSGFQPLGKFSEGLTNLEEKEYNNGTVA